MGEKEYKYMVAVQCMTFNQSKYILDALNGFVMQQTNFPYVVMVVDDASTDGEQEVIRKFVSEQFDINDTSVAYEKETDYAFITYAQHKINKNCFIAVLYLKENHYIKRMPKLPYLSEWRNYVKYEALCEGDDYWINPNKLQMQVEFMNNNPDYSLCFHNAIVFYEDTSKQSKLFNDIPSDKDISLKDLVSRWIVPTASIIIRTSIYPIPICDKKVISGDLWILLHSKHKGRVRYIRNVMSCYRITYNTDSITSKMKNKGEEMCLQRSILYKNFDDVTDYRYHKLLVPYIEYWRKYALFFKLKRKSILITFLVMPLFTIKKIYWKLFKNSPYA